MFNMFKKYVAFLCFFLPSAPTRFLYRLCGYHIGKHVMMPLFSYVYADEMTIGNDVDIRRFVYIHVHVLAVGASTIISYGNQIKGDASFTCGDNCFLGIHCLIHCAEDVTLGFYSGLGPRCTIYTHGSFLPVTMGYPAKFAPVVIDDYVWIAMEVTIMAGAHIEGNCIINPGIVIQGRVKSNSIVQLDPKQYAIHDLTRLQKINKKDAAFLHNQIISSFLDSQSASHQHDAGGSSYAIPGRYTFVSLPEKNCIELHIAGERISYDLGQFYADSSRRRIHRDFLSFIRLRHGITLRTRSR
jgi:acetyltransferase-like isoleucine patch superfamily enzyme